MGTTDNTFNNSGEGEQNIGQGDGAIGKQINAQNAQIGVLGNHAHVEGGIHYHQPPPTPPPVIPRQLPPLDDCFLGRDKELADLLEQLQPGKVVAVCGPGGMGKSALAAQAVSRLEKDRFPDGIVFHSFYGHPQTEQALQAVCVAFQVEVTAGLANTVRQVLSGRKALLILDGTEEADDLKAVLDLRSTCGVLITSRKRDDAQGFRLDLTPLEEQPAAEVFRLHSKGTARCAPTTTDDASVQGICKILDGWPVGLRIAGRYLGSTGESAAEYLRWLEQEPFKELGDGEHQEKNAALLLRRSVTQVSEDARLALGLAGTLAFAPIAREPVAAVLEGDERRARKALGELVNYGLLEKREERWQVSHALMHHYACTKLRLSKDTLSRLSSYYITFYLLINPGGTEGYIFLDKERSHCLRLMEICLAHQLWLAVQLLEGLLSEYLDLQSWWQERLTALAMRLTAVRQVGDRSDQALCLNNIGYTHARRREYKQALVCYEQCLKIRYELDERKEIGMTLNNIGSVYREQGEHEHALKLYMQSLNIALEISDKETEAEALNNIGSVYYEQGMYEKSLLYYEQCLPIRQEVGNRIAEGATLNNIAEIYRLQGDAAKALVNYKKALIIAQEMGNREGEAITYWNIGLTYRDLKDIAKIEEYISHAVQVAEEIGSPYMEQWHKALMDVREERQRA